MWHHKRKCQKAEEEVVVEALSLVVEVDKGTTRTTRIICGK